MSRTDERWKTASLSRSRGLCADICTKQAEAAAAAAMMKRSRPKQEPPPQQPQEDEPHEDEPQKPAAAAVAVVPTRRSGAMNSSSAGSCLQTPHTLRLLKLIRDGGSHTETAVTRLQETAQNCSDAVQLWDLLGRLQAFLTAPEWRTREAAARALRVVAHHVPAEDQRRFLGRADENGEEEQEEEEPSSRRTRSHKLYLRVEDLLRPEEEEESSDGGSDVAH